MSCATVVGVVPDRRPVELLVLRNSYGWAASIWGRMCSARGIESYWSDESRARFDELCHSIETLAEWEQAALVLTFDVGVIPFTAYEWAAEQLDEFDRRLPAPAGHANHLPAVAELFRSQPECPYVGVWCTNVSSNPFDPRSYPNGEDEDPEPGNGVPLEGLYLLPQHRSELVR